MSTATAAPPKGAIRARSNVHQETLDTWLLLQQGYLLTYKAIDQALAKARVSYAQASVLIALSRAGAPLPLSRLARTLVQEAQSITSLVDRLEARGLVRRVPDQRDRRVIKVSLTADGERLLDTVLPLAADAVQAAFGDIRDRDINRLHEQLERLRTRSASMLGIELGVAPSRTNSARGDE